MTPLLVPVFARFIQQCCWLVSNENLWNCFTQKTNVFGFSLALQGQSLFQIFSRKIEKEWQILVMLMMLFNRVQDGLTEQSKLQWKDEILPQSKKFQRANRKKTDLKPASNATKKSSEKCSSLPCRVSSHFKRSRSQWRLFSSSAGNLFKERYLFQGFSAISISILHTFRLVFIFFCCCVLSLLCLYVLTIFNKCRHLGDFTLETRTFAIWLLLTLYFLRKRCIFC